MDPKDFSFYEKQAGQIMTQYLNTRCQPTLFAQVQSAATDCKVQPGVWIRWAVMKALAEAGRNGFVLPGTTGPIAKPIDFSEQG